MGRKGLTVALSLFMLCFYIGIIMYVMFRILHVDVSANFEAAMAFEVIGFLLLTYFVLCGVWMTNMKTGYFVPLMMVTILYTIILDVINFWCVTAMKNVWFVLVHFVLLFIYCLISVPMYIMSRDK